MTGRDILIALYIRNKGDWDAMWDSIRNKKAIDVDKYLDGIDTGRYITILDNEYPSVLKESYKPPFVFERLDIDGDQKDD